LLFVPSVGVNRACIESESSGEKGPYRRIVWRPDLMIA
jgi:hypothetical protein